MKHEDYIYTNQLVQNENVSIGSVKQPKTEFIPFEHTPICPGTVTGTIWDGDIPIHTFTDNGDGSLVINDVGHPQRIAMEGMINYTCGEVVLFWDVVSPLAHLIVNYEYEMYEVSEAPVRRSVNQFEKPTFDNFFEHDELMDMAMNAATVSAWDFNSALGDTIMEKYESLYVKVAEMTNVLLKKGAKGYFWIVCNPEVASIFETATTGYRPCACDEDLLLHGQQPMGLSEVRHLGLINAKWRLYVDTEMEPNKLLIGCNDKREDNLHYARLSISNFII